MNFFKDSEKNKLFNEALRTIESTENHASPEEQANTSEIRKLKDAPSYIESSIEKAKNMVENGYKGRQEYIGGVEKPKTDEEKWN